MGQTNMSRKEAMMIIPSRRMMKLELNFPSPSMIPAGLNPPFPGQLAVKQTTLMICLMIATQDLVHLCQNFRTVVISQMQMGMQYSLHNHINKVVDPQVDNNIPHNTQIILPEIAATTEKEVMMRVMPMMVVMMERMIRGIDLETGVILLQMNKMRTPRIMMRMILQRAAIHLLMRTRKLLTRKSSRITKMIAMIKVPKRM